MGSTLCGEWKGEEQSEIDVESDGGKLNINYASVDELTESDHLTRAMAARLVCHREQFGPFLRPKDLHQIPGMRKGAAKKLGKEMSFDGTCAAWTCDLLSRCQGNCTKTCKCLMKWGGCGGCCECSCGSAETEEAIFFPDDEDRTGLTSIVELIENAQNTLEVAVYSISHKVLADALIAAQRRGVFVRVLTDDMQAKDKDSCVKMMKRADIKFRMDKTASMPMKHKFMVVDGRIVMSGSLDWTYAAVERGNENVIISKNREICDDFTMEFDRVWKEYFKKDSFPAPAGCWGCKATTLFFPSANQGNDSIIRHELNGACDSIDVAVFSLSLGDLADVLIRKHKDGLRVRVLTDRQALSAHDAQRLKTAGVEVRTDRAVDATHHNFAIVDGKTLLNGCFNWTEEAARGVQDHAVLYGDHTDLANDFTDEFEGLWDSWE